MIKFIGLLVIIAVVSSTTAPAFAKPTQAQSSTSKNSSDTMRNLTRNIRA